MIQRNLHILGKDVQVSVCMGQSDGKGTITVVLLFNGSQMVTLWEGLTWEDSDLHRQGYSAFLCDGVVELTYRQDNSLLPPNEGDYMTTAFDMQDEIAQSERDLEEVRERLRIQPFLTMRLHTKVCDDYTIEPGRLTVKTADGVTFHLAASHGIGYRMEVDSDGDTIFEFYEDAYAKDKVLKVIEDDDEE